MWSSWPWVSTMASILSRRSRIQVKSGRITSTPGWCSSGNSTPQSTTRRRPACSKTVMLRPISPRPPKGTRRNPPGGSLGRVSLLLEPRRLIASRSSRSSRLQRRCGREGGLLCSRSAFGCGGSCCGLDGGFWGYAGRRDFTERARSVVMAAQNEARAAHNDQIHLEHLVLGLLSEPEALAARAILAQGVTLEAVRQTVAAVLPPEVDEVPGLILLA